MVQDIQKNKKQNYLNRFNGLNSDGSYSDFKQCFKKYKYLLNSPFEVSNRCCYQMKENPVRQYERKYQLNPIIATMASESRQRKDGWLKTGCNAFKENKSKRSISKPLSFWTVQDVYQYIFDKKLPICSVYGEVKKNSKNNKYYLTGVTRTGCIFCMFGCHLEKEPNRFQRLKVTHPDIYEYCMKKFDEGGLGLKEVLDYIDVDS